MNKILSILEVIIPILTAVILGMLARKKRILSPEENRGLQQFVMNFGLPCVIFNSCLTAEIGVESVGTMLLVLPCMLVSTLWAFAYRKRKKSYHNIPMLFAAQETGMIGIPLFMILFGAGQAYRMGILDLTQAFTAYPVIAILSARTGANLSVSQILKKIFSSPLLILSLIGLGLNLTGIADWLDTIGIGQVISASTSFLAQPVSAMMIFSVGYNFSLDKSNRTPIFTLSAIHFGMFAVFCLLIQLGLFLIPNVDAITRWAILLYCALPASYLAPSLGRNEEDFTVASGVCSLLTIVSLLVFCLIAAIA